MAVKDYTPVGKLVRLPRFLDGRVKEIKTELLKQVPRGLKRQISENVIVTVAVNELVSLGLPKILKKIEEYNSLKFRRK
ncbi:MAG: hypothetical protein E3J72_10960 [Planctomycetota bacterium]|nr:MAG: hypothetical protein E3J72_10960 [Planctomycetota bacterium]